MKPPKIFKLAPKTILLQWEAIICEEIQKDIRETEGVLHLDFSEEILETTATYTEVAIYFKEGVSIATFEERFSRIVQSKMHSTTAVSSRVMTIPVCYAAKFGLDIPEVSNFHNITEAALIQLHTAPMYIVSFIGFLPGFPYLTGLSEKLYTPRKETPRQSISKGSVGIGGEQTGVYPSNSPGGWNIIGRSPLDFFAIEKEVPTLLKAGDRVKFQPISIAEFELISLEVASGVYQLKTHTL